MTILALIFAALAVVMWLGLVANVKTMHGSDQAGNGLAQSFAVLLAGALWIVLALFAGAAAVAGALDGFAGAWALLVIPASGAATVAAVVLLSGSRYEPRWPQVLPVVAPGLILALVAAGLSATTRRWLPTGAAHAAWAALLVLSTLPWLALWRRKADPAAHDAWIGERRRGDEAT